MSAPVSGSLDLIQLAANNPRVVNCTGYVNSIYILSAGLVRMIGWTESLKVQCEPEPFGVNAKTYGDRHKRKGIRHDIVLKRLDQLYTLPLIVYVHNRMLRESLQLQVE